MLLQASVPWARRYLYITKASSYTNDVQLLVFSLIYMLFVICKDFTRRNKGFVKAYKLHIIFSENRGGYPDFFFESRDHVG